MVFVFLVLRFVGSQVYKYGIMWCGSKSISICRCDKWIFRSNMWQVGTYFYFVPKIAQGWPHIDEKLCPQVVKSHQQNMLCCMKFQNVRYEILLPYVILFFYSVIIIPLSNYCSLIGHHIYDRPCSFILITSSELPYICFISLRK